MDGLIPNSSVSQSEPQVRTVTRELPNLRNPEVLAEYRRQRALLDHAAENTKDEHDFWESAQTTEGWV